MVCKNRLGHRITLRGMETTITTTTIICGGHVQTFNARALSFSRPITFRGRNMLEVVKGIPEFEGMN
jgi:hypothetical protein